MSRSARSSQRIGFVNVPVMDEVVLVVTALVVVVVVVVVLAVVAAVVVPLAVQERHCE